jgi:hypothetical protein
MAAHAAVKRELLVRYLDAWTPSALHGARRVTYAEGYAGPGDSAVAALRVFGEFADLLLRHELLMVLVGRDAARLDALRQRLAGVAAEYGSPPGLAVRTEAGVDRLVPALEESGALGGPTFAYLNSCGATPPRPEAVAAIGAGKGSELLIALDAAADAYREALCDAGLGRSVEVDLVDGSGRVQTLLFATASPKSLETFKNDLWALDEYAGIRYREPRDPERTLLDISLKPHLGPLRRALLAHLVHNGELTLAQLREYTAAETIYRAADAAPAVSALASSGAVVRSPAGGRLTAETLIRAA